MVVHQTKNLRTGRKRAMVFRQKGFKATVFKTRDGKARISVTRNMKKR